MNKLYSDLSYGVSRLVTHRYSTSFTIGTKCLSPDLRPAIYAIYGFVRLADEIVDSFHGYDRRVLLEELEQQYTTAVERGISINPIVNAFQQTVNRYKIEPHLIRSFFSSMKMDLRPDRFDHEKLKAYIYGSAEVVGLMCLRIFVKGNQSEYDRLSPYAIRLGAAFQKVNFLRDIRNDIMGLHRIYFPELYPAGINERNKRLILAEIYEDFRTAEKGIKQLPACSRLGVYTAYLYYLSLTRRIENTPADLLMQRRIRVSNGKKIILFGKACLTHKFIGYGYTGR